MDYTVRAMAHQDGPAIRLLDEMSPDSGAFSVVYRCLFDPYEVTMALHPGSLGVVAENPADKTLAGKAFVQITMGRFHGTVRPLGRLYGLVVHPDHRRRGLATTLYHKLLEQARKLHGPETIFIAAIQEGNEASLGAAKTWATQIVEGRTRYLFARTVIRPPRIHAGLRIRVAEAKDWTAVAEGTTRFRQNSEFATEITPEYLQQFHERQPFGFLLQTCLLAVNADDKPVAGMSVAFDGMVETGLYPDFPFRLRLLNRFLRFAPSNGVLKPLSVRDLWYAPGFEQAALDLWKTAAWQLRDKGNRLMAAVDPKSPVAAVLPKSSFLPFRGSLLALAVDKPVDLSKTLYLPF